MQPIRFACGLVFVLVGSSLGTPGCAPRDAASPSEEAGFESSRVDPAESWQPFVKTGPWNLRLPAPSSNGGGESQLPSPALAVAPLAPSDGDYGIKIYFAGASDPTWLVSYEDYNPATDVWNAPRPLPVPAPAVIRPPTGSDGTVIIVDAERRYALEMWRFTVTADGSGGSERTAHASSINVVDLRGSGVHRNVGVTAAGLPGIGGLLRSAELASGKPIRHKLWLAVHPSLLFPRASWPASAFDVARPGSNALLSFGDVIALGADFDVAQNECGLSPVLQRIAQALKDYGGIVQDQGGDSVGIVCEVDAVHRSLDVESNAMWAQLACLKKHLVRVTAPWDGAAPGGLGY